jgi:hypothetical protein
MCPQYNKNYTKRSKTKIPHNNINQHLSMEMTTFQIQEDYENINFKSY